MDNTLSWLYGLEMEKKKGKLITINAVPDWLYETIKEASERNRRSLSAQVLLMLEQSIDRASEKLEQSNESKRV